MKTIYAEDATEDLDFLRESTRAFAKSMIAICKKRGYTSKREIVAEIESAVAQMLPQER